MRLINVIQFGSENVTGLARLSRGFHMAQQPHDNVVLWHERDISHFFS